MQSYSNISDVQSSTNGDIDDIELQGVYVIIILNIPLTVTL